MSCEDVASLDAPSHLGLASISAMMLALATVATEFCIALGKSAFDCWAGNCECTYFMNFEIKTPDRKRYEE